MQNNDENLNQEVESQKAEVDYKALYEQTKTDLDSLVAKKDELLGETKRAKAAKHEVLQKMQQLEEQKMQSMQKNGEFETLWKSEQQRAHDLEQQLSGFKQNIRNEKINNKATQIANSLAKGKPENAELLKVFVEQSLNEYADELGAVGDDITESITQQFKQDKKYAPLLGGSMATGGGAVGGKPGNSSRSEITRNEFDRLPQEKRMKFIKSGGRIVNN